MILNRFLQKCNSVIVGARSFHSASVVAAARKGTRAKRDAQKKASKKVEIKKEFIPYQERILLSKVGTASPRKCDDHLPLPVDDVFFTEKYKSQIFHISEAIEMLRETAHPSQYDAADADIMAHIELSMSADKKNKFIGEFSNIILLPHPYEVKQKRTVLALCENDEMTAKYRSYPGVALAVGPECVKMVEKNELDFKHFDHVLSHVSLLPSLVSIRSHLRERMPNVKAGTAGYDLEPLIKRFLHGLSYKIIKDRNDHDYGSADIKLGQLTMKNEELEENLAALINDIEDQRPTKLRTNRLITLVTLKTNITEEAFKIDHNNYLPELETEEEAKLLAKAEE